jgi:hypothetical protein
MDLSGAENRGTRVSRRADVRDTPSLSRALWILGMGISRLCQQVGNGRRAPWTDVSSWIQLRSLRGSGNSTARQTMRAAAIR